MSFSTKDLGNRLKHARKDAGFKTAKSFAASIQMGETTYCQYETGRRTPSINFLIEFCEILNIDLSWLLTGQTSQILKKNNEQSLTQLPNDVLMKFAPGINNIDTCSKSSFLINKAIFTKIFIHLEKFYYQKTTKNNLSDILNETIDIYNHVLNNLDGKKLESLDDVVEIIINVYKSKEIA